MWYPNFTKTHGDRRFSDHASLVHHVPGRDLIFAKAGLLDGRRCTVHWEHAPALQEAFPRIALTRSLFEIDRDRITCSGGVARLDMMIALITRDHGHELGAAVSEWFLHTQIREGAKPQRMDLRSRLGVADDNVLAVLKSMEANLETPLSQARLAKLAGLSVRQMERSFRIKLGQGVHKRYLSLRLARSRQLLRETSLSILEIALATGFASGSQFSRAFGCAYGMPPREARRAARP